MIRRRVMILPKSKPWWSCECELFMVHLCTNLVSICNTNFFYYVCANFILSSSHWIFPSAIMKFLYNLFTPTCGVKEFNILVMPCIKKFVSIPCGKFLGMYQLVSTFLDYFWIFIIVDFFVVLATYALLLV